MFIEYYFLLWYFVLLFKILQRRPTETGAPGMMSPVPQTGRGQCVGKGRRGRSLVVVLLSLFFDRKVSHYTAKSSLARPSLTYFGILNSIQQQNLHFIFFPEAVEGCTSRDRRHWGVNLESLLGLNINSCGLWTDR